MTPDWNVIEALCVLDQPYLENNCRLVLNLNGNDVFVELIEEGIRIRSGEQRAFDYGLLVKEPTPEVLTLDSSEEQIVVESTHWRLEIDRTPFALSLQNNAGRRVIGSADDGHFVRKHRVPPMARIEDGWLVSVALSSGEPIYGLGEKWSALNKRGQMIRSHNHDALGVNAEISYKNTPFAWSPHGWGVFVHTPSAVTHSVGHADWSQRSYCCLVEDSCLDLFILAPKSSDVNSNIGANLIRAYTDLTGRAPMPPLWSQGVILSKAYYRDAEEIIAVAKEVRRRNMPCDVITFDGRAWQDTDTRFAFEWDPSRYPDPGKVVDQLKQLDFKICVWEYPLVSTEHPWFDEFASNGWLLKDRRTGDAYRYHWDQQAFGAVLTPLPTSGIVDFTHPDAYAFWRDAHKPLFDLGVDMIKADFGEQVEDDNMLASNGESGRSLHNVYAHLYNRCVFEAAQRYSKSGAFLFSRSAWTGNQRFNSQWGGDPQADWEGMMGNIRGGLSWGLSGAPFYATDVGGFYKDTRDDALYVRWAQAGIFSAHFRLHGIGAREPWTYSDAANSAVMKALQLRYRLQHYLRQAMQQSVETGVPVQRAMVLACPKEKQAWVFENQFMFGDDILVAPCFSSIGDVEFYLPQGTWIQFDPDQTSSRQEFAGGQVHSMTLRLDEMAVFIRKGRSIHLCGDALTTEQLPLDGNNELIAEFSWPA